MTMHKIKWAANALAVAGAVVILAGLAYMKLTPRVYEAVTRVAEDFRLFKGDPGDRTHESNAAVETRKMDTEVSTLQSSNLLAKVCRNLNRTNISGTQSGGQKSSDADAVNELKKRLIIRPNAAAKVIDIGVTCTSISGAAEAAAVANEIAKVYVSERETQHSGLIADKLAALKKEWDAQNEKVAEAQANVNTLYLTISGERATNRIQYYDPDAYNAMLSQRIDLETQYTTQNSELKSLKDLNEQQLEQTLSLTQTNVVLNAKLIALGKAQSKLAMVKIDHGDDSKDVKEATTRLQMMQRDVEETVRSVVQVKETSLAGVKSALAAVTQRIKNGSTNVVQANAQDLGYQQALAELTKLKADRDALQQKMGQEETKDAIAPTSATVEVIDRAEAPSMPSSPNIKLAAGMMYGGGVLVLAGLGLWGLTLLVKKRPA